MAIQNTGDIYYPLDPFNPGTSSAGSFTTQDTCSAANSGVAQVIYLPQDGTIDRVGFYLNAVTTGATQVVSMQTVNSPTNFQPTGTNYGGSLPASVVTTTATPGYYEAIFSTPATAFAGDQVAFCFNQPATSFGSFASTRISGMASIWPNDSPAYLVHNGTSWGRGANTGPIVCGIGYGANNYIDFRSAGMPLAVGGTGSTNVSSTGAVRYFGNFFTPTVKMRVRGMWFKTTSTARDTNLILWESTGTTALAAGFFQSATWNNITPTCVAMNWDDGYPPVVLTPGTSYIYTYSATNSTNVALSNFVTNTAGQLSAYPGCAGGGQYLTWYNGTSWSSNTSAVATGVGLIINGLDDGAGGGGGGGLLVNPGMLGGIR